MNSRWTTDPVKRKGRIVSTSPNVAGDLDILKAFGRHGLLGIQDVAWLTGRSYSAVVKRIRKLKKKPLCYLKISDTQLQNVHLYRSICDALHLTHAGVGRLQELGFEAHTPKSSTHFIHTLTQSQTSASFEVGSRLHELDYCPLPRPPLSVGDHRILQDGGPIGVGKGGAWRFIVWETDCASEPLSSSNRDRQSIESKFAAYLTALADRAFEQWEIRQLTVLFTTTTQTRMRNMIELLKQMTSDHKLLACFGFQCFPTVLMGIPQPAPGWVIAEEWHRAINKPLSLKDF